MNKFLLLASLLTLSLSGFAQDKDNWELVYHNDVEGNTIEGNIEALIEAVRRGDEVRIYWSAQSPNDKTKKVEHFADAKFLTVLSDSIVFAQIDPIIGQTPDFDSQTIKFKENLQWSLLAASNGKSDTMMRNVVTGEIIGHNLVPFAIKWYTRN
ncbi:hypothetical protein [Flagellimonas sp. CMM7]|uniref:hypothetical protein n=1 Tax=Flagellimonas sp. CMM7 TaxID=2654676 RepID=UPI0013D3537A|nr:hypothetical protein [Flagellimonas sp. CMM7]UII81649.1 hypothetical protein LV704_09075 [Flagellimonas sp. CMM7]